MTSELGLTIQSTLEGYTLPNSAVPYFAKVFKGEPESLSPSTGQALARWRVVRAQPPPEGVRNLKGDRMAVVVYAIDCFWPLTPLENAREAYEDSIATVMLDLPNDFIALTATTYTIGGYAVALLTVEDPSPVERGDPFGVGRDLRYMTFELHARVLEAT